MDLFLIEYDILKAGLMTHEKSYVVLCRWLSIIS